MTVQDLIPYIVAVDWGTSSFRARAVAESGKVLATVSTNEGIRNVGGEFKAVLAKHLSQLEGYSQGMPIVMSGMIGSRNGWREAPYTQLPCSSNSLASKMLPLEIEGIDNLFVVPGVFKTGEQSDVIRGEETEIVGARDSLMLQ
ncbi:MAG: 2-dehydro-3-deoxygalactonokinase [Vibrio sp.]|uniref:2-dehydro-3-deoxygalactonokinase n=1 Tax=Vibrio sp. TaxID=678 RepID=UPI003A858142